MTIKGKQTGNLESVQELAVRLENGFVRRQKSLINNIFATVIAAIILNIGATSFTLNGTVRSNSERLAKVEQLSQDQVELKEFVAALQIQYMYASGEITENKETIKEVRTKIESFVEKYYSTSTRGGNSVPKTLKH